MDPITHGLVFMHLGLVHMGEEKGSATLGEGLPILPDLERLESALDPREWKLICDAQVNAWDKVQQRSQQKAKTYAPDAAQAQAGVEDDPMAGDALTQNAVKLQLNAWKTWQSSASTIQATAKRTRHKREP